MQLPIKNWAIPDKPREKFLQKGRQSLTDSELLAILLGTGTSGQNVLLLAQAILHKANNSLHELSRLGTHELTQIPGIGPAKALIICAAMELARRKKHEPSQLKSKISSSEDAYQLMHVVFSELGHEEFWVFYLNRSNTVLEFSQLSKGGIDATIIDVKLLCKRAVELACSSVVVAHNHPSGSCKPSGADKKITEKIKSALDYFDIKLLDHVVFCDQQYFSFADEGLIG